jgi:hypothetical protein
MTIATSARGGAAVHVLQPHSGETGTLMRRPRPPAGGPAGTLASASPHHKTASPAPLSQRCRRNAAVLTAAVHAAVAGAARTPFHSRIDSAHAIMPSWAVRPLNKRQGRAV